MSMVVYRLQGVFAGRVADRTCSFCFHAMNCRFDPSGRHLDVQCDALHTELFSERPDKDEAVAPQMHQFSALYSITE